MRGVLDDNAVVEFGEGAIKSPSMKTASTQLCLSKTFDSSFSLLSCGVQIKGAGLTPFDCETWPADEHFLYLG